MFLQSVLLFRKPVPSYNDNDEQSATQYHKSTIQQHHAHSVTINTADSWRYVWYTKTTNCSTTKHQIGRSDRTWTEVTLAAIQVLANATEHVHKYRNTTNKAITYNHQSNSFCHSQVHIMQIADLINCGHKYANYMDKPFHTRDNIAIRTINLWQISCRWTMMD